LWTPWIETNLRTILLNSKDYQLIN
jgi:hypothetical protein